MRILAALALALTTMVAHAETGPPKAEEVARAKTACAAEVRQECLFVLVIDAALFSPDDAEFILNDIALAQATAGDKAGAERTLTLTTPGFLALMALGRDAEAAVALEALAEKNGVTKGEAKPPKPGEVALDKIEELVTAGQIDQALSTALAMPEDLRASQSKALRLIVDHYIERQDFAAAARVVKQMNAELDEFSAAFAGSFGVRYVDPRADALVAVVKAQAAAGDLAGAATLVDGMIDPRAQVNGRISLADAYFKAGATDDAKAQLDLILAIIQRLDLSVHFGLVELTQSADLAFLNGETPIARTHAELAYKTYSKPTVRRGAESSKAGPPRTDLLHLATVLQLVGLTDKGKALFAYASKPYEDSLFSTSAADHNTALLISQIRLDDPKFKATIAELLAKEEAFWSNGLHALHKASLDLVELGFVTEALIIADQLELRLRDDLLHLDGHDPVELYSAILAKDPGLAPQVLTDKLSAKVHFGVSLALAQSLHASGQHTQARELLQNLGDDHKTPNKVEPELSYPICVLRSIALTQETLGFKDDAAQSRQLGLALANLQTDPSARSIDLLILAASFPSRETFSLYAGFGCLEYPS
jgi:tetratricopeptide (TPR) repeat protein